MCIYYRIYSDDDDDDDDGERQAIKRKLKFISDTQFRHCIDINQL